MSAAAVVVLFIVLGVVGAVIGTPSTKKTGNAVSAGGETRPDGSPASTAPDSSSPETQTTSSAASSGNPKLAKAQALAGSGDASALTFVREVTKPFEGCTRPNLYATAPKSITGRALAADELAFFETKTPLDQHSCAAYLYVFRAGQSTHEEGFTAGAVIDDDKLLEVHVGGSTSAPFATYDYS